jgi:hypothetical protein
LLFLRLAIRFGNHRVISVGWVEAFYAETHHVLQGFAVLNPSFDIRREFSGRC